MAEALIITRDDVVKFTSLNGNVDPDKFIQYIDIAQSLRLEEYLGSDLLEALQTKIENEDLTGQYLHLVNKYCKPILIHYAMVEYLPFGAFQIANKGIFKHTAENSESVNKNDVDFLIQKELLIAQGFVKRMIRYLCLNSNDFPEYTFNSNNDVNPMRQTNIGGFYLNEGNEKDYSCRGWYL
jgi:hypothetical protein